MSGAVTWVAVAGLAMSSISVAWQFITVALGRRRIRVGLSQHVTTPVYLGVIPETRTPSTVELKITVENLGRSSMTVWEVGVRGQGPQEVATVTGWRDNRGEAVGPDLPAELEPGVTRTWVLPDDATRGFDDSVEWQAWASRWRGDHPPKEYRARRRVRRDGQ